MKSRKIYSKFFTDSYVQSLNLKQKWVYLFYLFNEKVNWLGCYEMSDKRALFEIDSNITRAELVEAQKKFVRDNKILFINGYVIIKNSERYEKFLNNNQLVRTALLQFKELPQEVRTTFLTYKPTEIIDEYKTAFLRLGYTIDCSLLSSLPVGYTVAEVISNKTEDISTKDISNKSSAKKVEEKLFLEKFNEVYQTNYTSPKSFINNFKTWRAEYSLEQILEAVEKSKLSAFWHDKLTPDKMLRTNADRIGEFLNIKQTLPKFEELDTPEGVDEQLRVYKIYQGRRIYANTAQPKGN